MYAINVLFYIANFIIQILALIHLRFVSFCRYFRFYGKIAQQPNDHNEATIRAIKENVDGLEIISGERIWSEWSKILSGNYAKELTLKMLECGIGR